MSKLLFNSAEWDFTTIENTWNTIHDIAIKKYNLDYYPPHIEMITSEQMLNAYSTVAMPIMYDHWSFGKSFIQNKQAYDEGRQGLAYEVVINTNPSIAYLMEDNTMLMQTLVMAHAICGHGSFFKGNYLFQEWTDADTILDYLKFAREYVNECEKKHGLSAVTAILDSCHALQNFGVDKYRRPERRKADEMAERAQKWDDHGESMRDQLFYTLPKETQSRANQDSALGKLSAGTSKRSLPEENILYFLEKNSPTMKPWQRELVRIVRKVAQYFYPQMQTQLMNEGWASFWHYTLMNDLYDAGNLHEGHMLEFLESHAGVVFQPEFDSPYYSGINVYALGFAMMQDIKRACENPDEEDRKFLPTVCDTDWLETIKDIMHNYRDESFVLQFLSPKVIRQFKLFTLHDDERQDNYEVSMVHCDDDVYDIREALAKQYRLSDRMPHIEVTAVDNDSASRALYLTHNGKDGRMLEHGTAKKTMAHVEKLWGFPVYIDYLEK